jgi:hypothetical protein
MLNLGHCTGELRLSSNDNEASIFFEQGNVTYAGIENRPQRLGDTLVRRKRVSRQLLNEVLRTKPQSQRLGEALIERNVIGAEELHAVVREQIKEVIYEIVRWEGGGFEFFAGRQATNQDIRIDIPLDHLMLEGLKRLDEEKDRVT